jgi:hypothetical protein
MSVERCVAIVSPLSALKTRSRSKNAAVIISCLLLVLSYMWYCLWGYTSVGTNCIFIFNDFFTPQLRMAFDYGVFVLLPGLVILLSNLFIIVTIRRSDGAKLREEQRIAMQDRQSRSLVAMLVAVSVAFLVLKTPLHVVRLAMLTRSLESVPASPELALYLALSVAFFLQFLNHAVNFYLYVLAGREFRSEFVNLVRRICCRKSKKDERSTSFQLATTSKK